MPTSLVEKNGSKILAITSGVMPTPVSSTSISTYSPAATPGRACLRLSRSLTLRVRMVRQPPSGMASRALTARLMITLSNCDRSALTYQRSRPDTILSSIFSLKERLRSGARSVSDLAELQHLGLQRLPAREGEQLAHQAGRPVGAALDVHDVAVGGVGLPVRLQQQVGEADDGGQHVVEVVRHAAGELAHRLHLVALGEFELQRLLLGGIDGIEHGAFACARADAERAHVDAPRQLALRAEGDLDGRRARAAGDRPLQRLGELAADLLLAVGHETRHRRRHAAALDREHAHERRVGRDDAAVGIGGGDAEGRRLEDARQPHLGVGVRFGAGELLAAVEHEHGDDAPGPVAAADELGREGAAVLAQQIELEPRRAALGAARHGADQVGAVGRHDVEQRQRRGRTRCAGAAIATAWR